MTAQPRPWRPAGGLLVLVVVCSTTVGLLRAQALRRATASGQGCDAGGVYSCAFDGRLYFGYALVVGLGILLLAIALHAVIARRAVASRRAAATSTVLRLVWLVATAGWLALFGVILAEARAV